MRLLWVCSAFCVLLSLCSCGSARTETAKAIANAKEAAGYIEQTSKDESVKQAARAIMASCNAGVNYLSLSWGGLKKDIIKATVTAPQWSQDVQQAYEHAIMQAAKAQGAIDSESTGLSFWAEIAAVAATALGAGGIAMRVRGLLAAKEGALKDALTFGKEALAVKPDDPAAVERVKHEARQRMKGTKHAKVLGQAMQDMNIG